MLNKKIKQIIIIIISPFIFLFAIEFFLRIFIFIITTNSGIIFYGINKNITLSLHSIIKGEFYITNNHKIINQNIINNLKQNDQVWIFGGSTSNKGFCDSKNLSWVDFLDIGLTKKNFSKNGINSNFSIDLLINELEKNQKPKMIIWTNKVNEILYIKRNSDQRNNIFYLISSIKKTLKLNSVFFYFFDEILLRLFDKMGINIRFEKINLTNEDFQLSAMNYFENTKSAIELAKIYDIDKFFIISLFNQLNLNNLETKFYNYYTKVVFDLIKLNKNVKYIDTKLFLRPEEKKQNLFCDSMHQNFRGKIITADIISNYINDR